MRHLSILTNCGAVGNVSDSVEEQEINAMIASDNDEDVADEDDDDDGGELVTNAEEREKYIMLQLYQKSKPEKSEGDAA